MGQPTLFDTYYDGESYRDTIDRCRLNEQATRVFMAIVDSGWLTLAEIERMTGDPQASISARLRDFRKLRFGRHTVERRRRTQGTWEYRLVVNYDAG